MPESRSDSKSESSSGTQFTTEVNTKRQQLVDDVAFLVVRQHRRQQRTEGVGESTAK